MAYVLQTAETVPGASTSNLVQCYGHARVVDPLGRIVCDTGAKQGMVTWSTDLLIDASRQPRPPAKQPGLPSQSAW